MSSKIKISNETEQLLITVAKEQNVWIEGNLIKLLSDENEDFRIYLQMAIEKDTEQRKKRLEMTKQVQEQNKILSEQALENDILMNELKKALDVAEKAKDNALNDLSVLQQKSQFEMIGAIVTYALYVIVGTGIVTTAMYVYAMGSNSAETTLIGNTWSNLFGILLTNSFSIIGTIMGVKYAQNKEKTEEK